MSRYINEAIEECIGVLAFENNYKIKRALINTLLKTKNKHFSAVIESNTNSLYEIALLISYLEKEGNNDNKIQEILPLNRSLYFFIKKQFRIFIETSKNGILLYDKNQVQPIIDSTINIIDATTIIISKKITNYKSLNDLSLVMLQGAQLYKKTFIKQKIDKVVFSKIIGRHCLFKKVKFTDCLFDSSNLIQAKFIKTDFGKCHFESSKFIESKFYYSNIGDLKFENCDLTKSNFVNTGFSNVVFRNCNLNGIKISNKFPLQTLRLKKLKFNDCKIIGAQFINMHLNNIIFNGGDLAYSVFINCVLNDIDFNGTSLKGVTINDCIVNRCCFNGNDIQKLSLINSKLVKSSFYKCKNIEKTKNGIDIVKQLTMAHSACHKSL